MSRLHSNYVSLQYAGFTVQFTSLELVKSHLQTNHRVTEKTCQLSSIILPAKHRPLEQQITQFASEKAEDEDELCVLEEIAPPRFTRFPSKTVEDGEVEVMEEIPPVSFRRKPQVRNNWRVDLLRKMREMRFLPTDQLAVQLRKAQDEIRKKRQEAKVFTSFRKKKKGRNENDMM